MFEKGRELVNPTERRLAILHNAMKNMSDSCFNEQKDSGILDNNSLIIPVKYHRICYHNYTGKHNQSYRQGIDFDEDCLTRSGAEPMDLSKCLFCGCLKRRGDRSLVQICTFPVQEKIKNAAKELGDYGLLAKVLGNNLIALQVKYHKNCLAEIITKAKRRKSRPSNEESETSVFDNAFD